MKSLSKWRKPGCEQPGVGRPKTEDGSCPRSRGLPSFNILLIILLLLSLFSACKEKEEGCMDITAVNWDAGADKPCDDCCTYPSLKASFSHLYGDTLVLFDSVYLDDSNNPFLIAGIRYYISDFYVSSNGTTFHPTDTIDLELIEDGDNVEATLDDNFGRVSKSSTSATFGNFENTDLTVDTIGFLVGLNAEASKTDPLSVDNGHPLSIDSDSLFVDRETGYVFVKISIVPDTMTMDTVVYRITNSINALEMRLDYNKSLVRGEDVTVPLQVNYYEWFKGIDFVADPTDSVKVKIVNNLSDGFSIQE